MQVPKLGLHDPAYRKAMQQRCVDRSEPCYVCGKESQGDVVPAHVKAKRRFGDKWNIVFLCSWCHGLTHDRGYAWFEAYSGVSKDTLLQAARDLYQEYLGEKG